MLLSRDSESSLVDSDVSHHTLLPTLLFLSVFPMIANPGFAMNSYSRIIFLGCAMASREANNIRKASIVLFNIVKRNFKK